MRARLLRVWLRGPQARIQLVRVILGLGGGGDDARAPAARLAAGSHGASQPQAPIYGQKSQGQFCADSLPPSADVGSKSQGQSTLTPSPSADVFSLAARSPCMCGHKLQVMQPSQKGEHAGLGAWRRPEACLVMTQAGATEVFADHLPGLPDGVSRASSPAGAFWCAAYRFEPLECQHRQLLHAPRVGRRACTACGGGRVGRHACSASVRDSPDMGSNAGPGVCCCALAALEACNAAGPSMPCCLRSSEHHIARGSAGWVAGWRV